MRLDFIQIFNDAFNALGQLLSSFTDIKVVLSVFIVDMNNFNFTNYLQPFLGTIKTVIGNKIYFMTITSIQIALFVGLSKAFYQIVHIVLNSGLIKKPLAIIKDLIGL